ncbi:hypothetical protein [Paenibacillus sp. N3.4]|nr:hypothetical protein [Paenibacillus sp. N3.4]
MAEVSRCLDQVEKRIGHVQRIIQKNWDAYVNAQFDLVRERS